jgi:NAD(P)H-hydrate epimerase
VQAAVPEATAALWPETIEACDSALGGADALVIGPGLGPGTRDLVLAILGAATVCTILDADALNAFAGVPNALRDALGGRAAIITPHAAECARLLGITVGEVLASRFDLGAALARETGAVVVLKGTPTVISAPDGRTIVAPVGSPVLATGGSGDILAGVIGALAAVMADPMAAAKAGVWAHGAAAERAGARRVRGVLLSDVLEALGGVWHESVAPLSPGVLASLPAVGER